MNNSDIVLTGTANGSTPKPYVNIMVTYKKEVGYGPYRERKVIETVTKRGFYCPNSSKVDGSRYDIAIPPGWRDFTFRDGTTALLPHGWGGDRLRMEQVLSWKYESSTKPTLT